jgi:flagellar basal-body rod modification protein FlgD
MSVSAPSAPVAGSSQQNTTNSGRDQLASSFDTFLSLLTTQMKNQDPLAPMDSTQFTQQLVQMTGVEQQLNTNDLLQKLVTNTGSGISTAVALIGKQVRAATDGNALNKGTATWSYKLDRDASDVKIEVLDSKGKVVHSEAPTKNSAGEYPFTWNGKDQTGTQLPDGSTYTLKVTAKDSQGTAVSGSTYVDGVVTGVEQVDGKTLITINGAKIPWETVNSISEAAAAANPTPDPTGS